MQDKTEGIQQDKGVKKRNKIMDMVDEMDEDEDDVRKKHREEEAEEVKK